MERRQLEYFVAVAEHRGFSKAATTLHVSQSTLSRAIQELEREMGVPLFRRVRQGVVPTASAERMLRRARGVLREFEAMTTDARAPGADLIGTAIIAVTPGPSTEPLARIVAALQQLHPSITVEAKASASAQEAIASLHNGEAEIALFGDTQRQRHQGIRVREVEKDELMLAIPPGSTLSALETVRPENLRDLPFVLAPVGNTMQRFIDELQERTGGLRVVARASHRHAVLPLVARGVGAAVLSGAAFHAARAHGVSLRGFEPPRRISTWLAHPAHLSGPARAFVDAAVQESTL